MLFMSELPQDEETSEGHQAEQVNPLEFYADQIAQQLLTIVQRPITDKEDVFQELVDGKKFPKVFNIVTYQLLSEPVAKMIGMARKRIAEDGEFDEEQIGKLLKRKTVEFLEQNLGLFEILDAYLTYRVTPEQVRLIEAAIIRATDFSPIPPGNYSRPKGPQKDPFPTYIALAAKAADSKELTNPPSEARGKKTVARILEGIDTRPEVWNELGAGLEAKDTVNWNNKSIASLAQALKKNGVTPIGIDSKTYQQPGIILGQPEDVPQITEDPQKK